MGMAVWYERVWFLIATGIGIIVVLSAWRPAVAYGVLATLALAGWCGKDGASRFFRGLTIKRLKCQATEEEATSATEQLWDFIIVGGGTAGCVLANRLSAVGKRVLLLEAGGSDYDNKRMQMPAGVLELFQTKYDWHFNTQSDSDTSGHSVYICRGKVLGGSSSLNVLLYTRGDASDYNLWGSEFGLSEWTAAKVLPYFICTEDDNTGLSKSDPKHHGKGGEWSVDHVRYQNELSRRFLKSCAEYQLPSNSDFNNWDQPQVGAGRFAVSQKDGARCSAASAFLTPVLHDVKRRLTILCGAVVHRVAIDDHRVTSGVEFSIGGDVKLARLAPGGEVLLAAGALQTPQLLMLSGIGPREHLTEHGIRVIQHLTGVGKNLQDHPAVNVAYQCPSSRQGISPTSHCFFIFGKKVPHPWWILRWLLFRSGPLTSPGCDHGGFFHTPAAPAKNGASPDLQLRFLPARAVTADGMNSFAQFRKISDLPDGFSFQSIAVRPHSRGCVHLSSSNVRDKPVISGGYLSDKRDLATLREGIRLSRRLAQQPAFRDFLGHEVFPGPDLQSDEQLDSYITGTIHSANACVGSCRMGRSDDPDAVCDSQLRVIGVSGLRVCDASVMPLLPGGQTGATTVMIAERASAMIVSSLQSRCTGGSC